MSTTDYSDVVFESPYYDEYRDDPYNSDPDSLLYGGDYSSASDAADFATMPGWAGLIVLAVLISLIAWWVVSR